MAKPRRRTAGTSRVGLLSLALAFLAGGAALAGPPFVSDDPQPTDLHHWEIYNFVTGTNALGVTDGEAGLDLNYGAAKDLQLTAVLPVGFDSGKALDLGGGEIELAAKYKFLHQSDSSWTPDIALFPRFFVPTDGARFGSPHVSLLLPVWAEKDFGKWSVFGGGGYTVNPGPGHQNFWLTGIAVQRTVTDRLALGVEVYRHTADAVDGKPFTGLNLGVTYKLVEHWSLLASGGPGVENTREEGRYAFYIALKADY